MFFTYWNVNDVLNKIQDIGILDRVHPGCGIKGLKIWGIPDNPICVSSIMYSIKDCHVIYTTL